MLDNYQIDKNSKLFQKFMQSKLSQASNNEFIDAQPLYQTPTIYFPAEDPSHSKSIPRQIQQPSPTPLSQHPPAKEERSRRDQQIQRQEELEKGENYPTEQLMKRQDLTRDFTRNSSANAKEDFPVKQEGRQPTEITETRREKREFAKVRAPAQQNPPTLSINRETSSLHEEHEDGQYRRKYERLLQKYEQMRQTAAKEKQERDKSLLNCEEAIAAIRDQLFQVQSREDDLTIECKKLKDRLDAETLMRIKLEEENKEYTYRLQECQDMLESRDSALRRKQEECAHLKHSTEVLKNQVVEGRMTGEQHRDRINFLESENSILRRDNANKDALAEELRQNIPALVHENNLAKDQLYALTTRLFRLEQENQVLQADLRRGTNGQHPGYNFPNQSAIYTRNSPDQPTSQGVERRQPQEQRRTQGSPPNVSPQPSRVRGEFAKERSKNVNVNRSLQPEIIGGQRTRELNEELEKLKDSKAMNGQMRRRKIEIERELESLEMHPK